MDHYQIEGRLTLGKPGDADRRESSRTPNTAALEDPTEALLNQDLLPPCVKGEEASRSCAVLGGRLSRAAEFVSLSHGLVLRLSFFLLVRWYPPLRGDLE
jgi:hypothetical protein